METALIGFGGCGKNILASLGEDNSPFLRTALVEGNISADNDDVEKTNENVYSVKDLDNLANELADFKICFLAGGLGGTTCWEMPILSQKLRNEGVMTIALVTWPFKFESRNEKAENTLHDLTESLDAAIVFDNDAVVKKMGKRISLNTALKAVVADMRCCVQAVTSGMLDVVDVRACLHGRIFYGIGNSEEDIVEASQKAVHALEENLPSGSMPTGVLAGFFSNDPPAPPVETMFDARRILKAEDASWLVVFGNRASKELKTAVFMASGSRQ